MKGVTLFGLNSKGNKSPSARQVFLKTIDELIDPRYKHKNEFWILTCYINFSILSDFINKVKAHKSINNVYLMFNIEEAYKAGIGVVNKMLGHVSERCYSSSINFEWKAISTNDSSLMHAKAYAFFQRKLETNIIESGFHLITSGNFTKPGFQTASNIELGYFTQEIIDLRKFETIYDYLWENNAVDLTLQFSDSDDALFPFALLSYGVFIYKWTGNINSLTGIKYDFTDDAIE